MTTPIIRMMADIETMGVHQSKSLILSVGLTKFILTLEKPIIVEERIWVPTLGDQLHLGRVVEERTQKWWQGQPSAAAHHWAGLNEFPTPTGKMLLEMRDFYELTNPCSEIWANGIVFDIGNLDQLYRDFKMESPWKYNATRDMRTMVRVNPENQVGETPKGFEDGVPHHPLADNRHQILQLWRHWDFVGGS